MPVSNQGACHSGKLFPYTNTLPRAAPTGRDPLFVSSAEAHPDSARYSSARGSDQNEPDRRARRRRHLPTLPQRVSHAVCFRPPPSLLPGGGHSTSPPGQGSSRPMGPLEAFISHRLSPELTPDASFLPSRRSYRSACMQSRAPSGLSFATNRRSSAAKRGCGMGVNAHIPLVRVRHF